MNGSTTVDQVDRSALRPLIDAIPSVPRQGLDDADLVRVRHGSPICARTDGDNVPVVALVDDKQSLIAIAERVRGELRPKVVLHDS